MRRMLILSALIMLIALPAAAELVSIDGVLKQHEGINSIMPANTIPDSQGRVIDIVGSSSNVASNPGRAKGNSYRVDSNVMLNEVLFYLNFTGTQTLVYYVFQSPVEFGTYTEVYRFEEPVTGSGEGWYSSGSLSIPLNAGKHYIFVVSWSGDMTYYYEVIDEWATSFGAAVHGYASGYHPLPSSFESMSNDQACYYQQIVTNYSTPAQDSNWGRVKAIF